MARTARFRLIAKRLILVGASTLLGLIICELVLRSIGRATPRPFHAVGEMQSRDGRNFIDDAVTGWRMRPSHSFEVETDGVRIEYLSDDRGFRTSPTRPAESASSGRRTQRFVAVGDSFCFGLGVPHEQSFAARAARNTGFTEFHNLAMPGFGVDQIYLSVREHALPLAPDLLLVAIYEGDFERSRTAFRIEEGFAKPLFKIHDGELVPRTAADRAGALTRWLERNSYAFTGARRVVRRLGRYLPIGEWWTLNEAILDALRAVCDESSLAVLFVHIPDPSWKSIPTLRRYMKRHDAAFLDPTEIVPDCPEGAYFADDPHLSARGHALFAGWIETAIREHYPQEVLR